MLVASIVGVDMRATMDIDTTVRALPLNENDAERIISEICEIPIEDGVCFSITSITNIMTDFEYPEIRFMFEDRTISLLTYNAETFLAEKIQTIFTRKIKQWLRCGSSLERRTFCVTKL